MEEENIKNKFFIVRTSSGKENKFMEDSLKLISKREDSGIFAMFRPETVKGYIFVEAENLTKVVNAFRNIPNSKGVIKTEIFFPEIEKYFDKDGENFIVKERDIVEIIAGPFKGDKAKVIRIVPGKEDIVIEPISMAVPIPITLSKEDIRVIKESEKNE